MLYICDIDGTVADCRHRLHYIQEKPKNWKAFYEACSQDAIIYPVTQTIKALADKHIIVFSTGRSDEVKFQTQTWLLYVGLPCHSLYMRKAGDYREDYIVKAELLQEIQLAYREHPIAGIFEDRQQVVDMYRSKGLTVFQVADGKF